jgi:hypothetical protein
MKIKEEYIGMVICNVDIRELSECTFMLLAASWIYVAGGYFIGEYCCDTIVMK